MPNYRFTYPVRGTLVHCCGEDRGQTFTVVKSFSAKDDAEAVEIAKKNPDIKKYHIQTSDCSLVRIDRLELRTFLYL